MWPGGLRQQRVDSSTRHDLPPTSICIRPTDRPIYASRPRLVRGPALRLPPSLPQPLYPAPSPGRENQQNAEKNQGYAQKYTPRHQMTKNKRRVGGGCNKEAGKKQRVKRQARSSSPIYQHSLRCKLMLARVLGVDMQRGSMPCAS